MVFHCSESKSSHVSRTLLSILADLNTAIVTWMVSTYPVISKSSSLCTNPLVTVPSAPITIGIIVTFMFHSFFNSLLRSRYLSFFSISFNFTLWSVATTKSTILQVLFSFLFNWLLKDLVVWPGIGDPFYLNWMFKNEKYKNIHRCLNTLISPAIALMMVQLNWNAIVSTSQ